MNISMRIFSDYIWPFCYIGKGLVDELKKEFDIQEEWLPFEIHPETPPEGILLTKRLPNIDWDELYGNLRQSGARYGITFGHVTLLSNSRKALEAGEYARDQGKYERFHNELFYAYFTQALDIGRSDIIMGIAEKAGLDTGELQKAFQAKRYLPRLEKVNHEAQQYGITGAPTFIINNAYTIVGAQPLEVFRDTLKRL